MDENPELQRQWTSLIPQGKMGQPEDLMGAVRVVPSIAPYLTLITTQVTYLLSDAAGYVTG